jgi:hypothetical protein
VEASETWSKRAVVVTATSTDHNARLALTSATRGVFWLDQVSAAPTDTYKVLIMFWKRSFSFSFIWVKKGSCIVEWDWCM